MEARNIAETFWKQDVEMANRPTAMKMWVKILNGFAKEDNALELQKTVEVMAQIGVPFNMFAHSVVASYFADKDDSNATKYWYSRPVEGGIHHRTYRAILKYCIRNNQME